MNYMDEGFWRKPEVLIFTGLSNSVLYREMEAGRFPKPARIGPRVVGWVPEEVRAWKTACVRLRDGKRGPGRPKKQPLPLPPPDA